MDLESAVDSFNSIPMARDFLAHKELIGLVDVNLTDTLFEGIQASHFDLCFCCNLLLAFFDLFKKFLELLKHIVVNLLTESLHLHFELLGLLHEGCQGRSRLVRSIC